MTFLLLLFVSVFDYRFLYNIIYLYIGTRGSPRSNYTNEFLFRKMFEIFFVYVQNRYTLFCHQIRKRSECACRELEFYTALSLNKDEDRNLTI